MSEIKEPRLPWIKTEDDVITSPAGNVKRPSGNWYVKFPINNAGLPPLLAIQYVPVMYSDGYFVGTVLNVFQIQVDGNLFDPRPAQVKMEEQLLRTLPAITQLFNNVEEPEELPYEETTKVPS